MREKLIVHCRKYHYLYSFLLACLIAFGAVLYSGTLYKWVDGDEIVALESEKALNDPEYPEKDLISHMGYKTYLFPKIVTSLNTVLPLPKYKSFLLFIIVASTIFCAYVALFWLRFPRWLAFATALVAITPRFAPVGETFGALTPYEIQGRNLAVPLFWLLSAGHINNIIAQKSTWPLFLVLGVVSYIHPATMIMFFCLLLLVHFGIIASRGKFLKALKESVGNILAFALGASFLLYEIITRTHNIVLPVSDVVVTTQEFVQALRFRIPWEYPPHSIAWLRHVLIVGGVFFASSIYVLWKIRKGDIRKDSRVHTIATWSAWVLAIAFVVHLSIPTAQLYLIEAFNSPLILWQFGRIYKFTYLALVLFFVITVYLVHKKYQKKILTGLLLVFGLMSSSFSFEWLQFLIGYPNYQKEYIPAVLQQIDLPNQYDEYNKLCGNLKDIGVKTGDTILVNDFSIRYFCGIRPHTSFEEGTAYIFMGKESLVGWHKDMIRQTNVLKGGDILEVLKYAEETGASAVALPASSPATRAFSEIGNPMFYNSDTAYIYLELYDEPTP